MLYIHIPFCKGKCIYCDFYSAGNPDWKTYIKAVVAELRSRIDELTGDSLSSIYIGGGTPSLIPKKEFSNLMESIYSTLHEYGIGISPTAEITLEVNPEDVEHEIISIWKSHGINRISMGIQTLNSRELAIIKRRHTREKAIEALNLISNNFKNFSVDIIYGLPQQTMLTLKETLDTILKFNPPHLSAYSLTYEPSTALTVLTEKGILPKCKEDILLLLGEYVVNLLQKCGYKRYEISNFSRPGFHSRHNSGYWAGKPYLGLGPSAASYDGNNIRRHNPAEIQEYITHFSQSKCDSKDVFYVEEKLTSEQLYIERIYVSLRKAEGIDLNKTEKDFGTEKVQDLIRKSKKWIKSDHIYISDNHLSLTNTGISISDHIILDLL